MKKTILPLLLSTAGFMGTALAEDGITVTEEINGKVKTQTIKTQDRYGTIEEQRVQAMYSDIRYLPASGGEGYSLTSTGTSETPGNSAHSGSDELMIPTWNIFSW